MHYITSYIKTMKNPFWVDVLAAWDRPGQASNQNRCDTISSIPPGVNASLGLNSFYSKYTHAYNIPVLGSSSVSDQALKRACYVVSFMLADRPELRQAMYAKYGRVAIMATHEVTRDIPEHSSLPESYNTRARGLGGTLRVPVSTGAEENVLCLSSDRYYMDDILVHELAHGIHLISLKTAVADFHRRLTNAFNCARKRSLWTNTYANVNVNEYFAEGTQSFFNVQRINNNVDTRDKLASHDPALYNLLSEVFPCENNIVDRCDDQGLIASQLPRMDCQVTTSAETYEDKNRHCRYWARTGECVKNPLYMLPNCALSCLRCKS
ncbi:hypothetical protein HOLleu_25184 [Holothuria leucospilota]|uniref:ShKT domain-containing protein n=1 Tax=Holothuria leucospilota TaxID=206669 RepID=A0A9Q1BSI1_HOLLE|nr:hypothetical protein HOLleu_25184 [Holothuria leucospilota]